MTLTQARAKRNEAKKLLGQRIGSKDEQKEVRADNSRAYTFGTIARKWHVSNKRWNEDHRSRVLRYLELYIFPHIGLSDIRQLKTSHLLALIKKLMLVVSMTLHSVFSSVSRLLYVMRSERYIDSNSSSDMAGVLSKTKAGH